MCPTFHSAASPPLHSDELGSVATRLDATPIAVALAWLLRRSPNILLIPRTSSVAHLRDNVTRAALALSENDMTASNSIAS
ncbi:aldo/keto reductase [Mycobacterium sp. BMJ-28]